MLKVIAEDFMQPDAVEILMPMYEELVAPPAVSRCVSVMICLSIRKTRGILFLSKPGRIRPRWIPIAPVSTSAVWCPPLISISVLNRVFS